MMSLLLLTKKNVLQKKPLNTALYHTDEFSERVTLPITEALGATKTF